MHLLKLTQEIKSIVARNDTEQALKLLNEALAGHPLQNIFVIRAAENHGLKKEVLSGAITWEQAQLTRNKINNSILELLYDLAKEEINNTKIFISYDRAPTTTALSVELREKLKSEGFPTFLDIKDTPVGADWALTILNEINNCQYLILLISSSANYSELVLKEIEEAHKKRIKKGAPIILPVRVNFPISMGMNDRLYKMLHGIQHLEWNEEKDTGIIFSKIMDVLFGRVDLISTITTDKRSTPRPKLSGDLAPSPVAPLEVPRGAVRLESKYYIKRNNEDAFIRHVETPGALLRIRGPRQFGKTSLLTRVIHHAVKNDYIIVAIDFQEFDEEVMSNLDKMLWEFCSYFAEDLDIEDKLEKRWARPRAKKQTCTAFIEKDILRARRRPILVALDEADRLFRYKDVSTEFFLLLRSWHEKSKVPNKKEWEKFRLALSYSTEAKLAIQDLNASPFNVGEEAKLPPFQEEQVMELANRHGLTLGDDISSMMDLLAGHPYLTRRALYLLAKQEFNYRQLLEKADKHDGPFSDHLRHHLVNIKQFQDASKAMKLIIEEGLCKDPIMATRLEATGLVKGTPPDVVPTNGLYGSYFKGKL